MGKAHSLIGRFLLVVLISILFNLIFSLGMIFFTGTFQRMELDSYEEFAVKANNDLRNVNRLFESYGLSATFMATSINERVRLLASENNVALRNLDRVMTEEVLNEARAAMQLWPSVHRVSGTYFLLCGDAGDTEGWRAPGVYIRASTRGLGYECEIGPRSIIDQNNMQAGAIWKPDVELSRNGPDSEFLRRLTGRTYHRASVSRADGYWSPPHNVLGGPRESISFSIPLLDDENHVYAVFGVVLDNSLLTGYVLPREGDRFFTRYSLAGESMAGMPPKWVISSSEIYRNLWTPTGGMNRQFVSSLRQDTIGITVENFDMTFEGRRQQISGVFGKLELYPADSPFAPGRWALSGLADRHHVLQSYSSMLFFTVSSIVLAALGAGLLVFVIARRQLRQITLLSSGAADGSIELGKTNIAEIDHLADVLGDMQKNVAESALRVSAIFDMLELPMGLFEVRNVTDRVFVTPSLKKVLERDDLGDSMFLALERWNEIYTRLKSSPFEDEENVYRWNLEAGNDRMKLLRIEEVCRYGSILGIITDVTDHLRKSMELEFQANYDSLTRLYNRRFFKQKVIEQIRREPGACGVMLFGDLDGLKQINDEYGHACGDELIKAGAEMMATFQSIGGITSRLSGDEFAAYLHGFKSRKEALETLIRHMGEHFNRTIRMGECVEKTVSISRGISCYPSDSNDFSNLLTFADYAMYQAKHSNKGSVRIFDRSDYLNDAVLHRKNEALVEAVAEGRISYVFQPMYDLKRKVVCGYGVFMRPTLEEFKDPKGLLDIAVIAERQSMLEKRIFHDVLIRIQQEKIDENTMICVKTVKNYILDSKTLGELKAEFANCFRNLVVLISADSTLDNDISEKKLHAYREAGARVAFERGFGDSLSDSLEMIKMRPDMVQINVGLIRDAVDRSGSRLKLNRIVSECEQNGITLVAVEIESKQDYELAKKMGFDIVQGYYIGNPDSNLVMPAHLPSSDDDDEGEHLA